MLQASAFVFLLAGSAADPRGTSAFHSDVVAATLLQQNDAEIAASAVKKAAPTIDAAGLNEALKQAQDALSRMPGQHASTDTSPEADVPKTISEEPMRVAATPHVDFANLDSSKPSPLEDLARLASRGSLVRRESRSSLDEIEPEARRPHYHEDPDMTPEAIYANKHVAPEVAEFLGHLAQKARVHHKMENKAAHQAALAQGRAMTRPGGGDEDDDASDDIEDMKKNSARKAKTSVLSHFFDAMDSKATAASWIERDCTALVKNVTDQYNKMGGRSRFSWETTGPAGDANRHEVHTGMFFKHWGAVQTRNALRKLRLGILSFLATQDPTKVKLHIWTDMQRNNETMKDILGPIIHHPELMDALNITTFDPKLELAKVPPTFARMTLEDRFKKDTLPDLRSDLYRSMILYNYGGMWMDADTVLMQDIAPLLGEDWTHLVKGKEGAVGGSLISVSQARSHFATDYLISMVMRDEPLDGEVQKPVLVEIYNNDPAHTTMHVLPPCFVDVEAEHASQADAAVLSSGASPGSSFFGTAVPEAYRSVFADGIKDAIKDNSTQEVSVLQDSLFQRNDNDDDDEQKPAQSPTYAYHWRGNFNAEWARGSLADVAERTFMMKLGLNKKRNKVVQLPKFALHPH